MFTHVSRLARSIAVVAVILLIQSGSTFFAVGANAQAESAAHHPFVTETPALPSESSAMKANSDLYTVFLPLIFNKFPFQTIFGAGMGDLNASSGLNIMVQAGLFWARADDRVSWADVEPVEGTRNWSMLATQAQGWQTASSLGIQPIAVVRVTPSWAQKVSGYSCGPIATNKLSSFASFMHDLVARYSVAPYNVKYWEIWNEPDIDYHLVGPTSDWGCWGDQTDAYYGGGYYATMLKAVYPQIKAADAQAQVLVGGLLLDCDPRGSPSACAKVHPGDPNAAKPPMFLEGILKNGGAPYFDGISFHSYDFYNYSQGQLGNYSNANWNSGWNTTGPDIAAKAEFIKSLLNTYHVSGKFLMNTESGIICDTCSSDPTFETTKAYYVAQAYAVAIAEGLSANLWYSVLGWRNSGLLNPDLSTLPAYTAFQVSRSELLASTLVGALTPSDIGGSTAVKGYKFNRGDRLIWVVWSLDGSFHSITPTLGTPLVVVDALGSAVTPAGTLTVGLDPLYLEWAP